MRERVPPLNLENLSTRIEFYETALGAKVENSWELGERVRWARLRFGGGWRAR